jgi:UDP-N-acetylglucosamine:LPS N-acetylglucosamine transferase
MTSSVILEKSEHKSRYHPYPYLNELSLRMSAGVSKLVLSRAGSTLFEISSWGIPCIVIPIPEDISHDQLGNAFAYAHTGAGIVIEEKNLTQHLLQFEIDRLINDLPLYEKMSDAAKKIDSVNSAEKIAREIFKIALSHEK